MDPTGLRLSALSVPLAALAERHGGEVDEGARALLIARLAPLDRGEAGDLCPFIARRHLTLALRSSASLLVAAELAPLVPEGRRWVHAHAGWALAAILAELETRAAPARSPHAFIDPRAEVAPDVTVGPFAVIMAGAIVGPGSDIGPHAVVHGRVQLGARVTVGAGAVIGRPGFGWVAGPGGDLRRIPQLGGVLVEDDVEIGPLATVDAGTLAPTFLARGVKLDAHVHVGHNVELGPGAIVAAQSGFAGSVKIGAGVRVGGQAGVADHVTVGAGAQIAAKAGVIGDVRAEQVVAGYPAVDRPRWLRGMALLFRAGDRRK